MTCTECQQMILLHDLMDEQERQLIIWHKSQCPACQTFWVESLQWKSAMSKVANSKPKPANVDALTDQIMSSVIRQRAVVKSRNLFEQIIIGNFTRLALSGISMVLVILFIAEVKPSHTDKPKGPIASLQVVLNSSDFRRSFNINKSVKKSLLSHCTNSENKVDLSCLKAKTKF